ncbi:MAG TPA: putative lipid II flippase FtsW [Gammaproteobacteria bacterium]|nr:putative lipid II flippase FtsW [Gammaproteobacteria bacterium]
MIAKGRSKIKVIPPFDPLLIFTVVVFFAFGIIMVTSSSIVLAERHFGNPFYYTIHQSIYLLMGLSVAFFLQLFPLNFWQKIAGPLMIGTLFALGIVLIPGIGKVVNGSARWLSIGGIGFQISEFSKLTVVIYLASYMVRHGEALANQFLGFVRPMLVLTVVCVLLLFEPDFGATVVILMTSFGLLFLGGAPLTIFGGFLLLVMVALGALAVAAPYRLLRLTAFLDPWADQFDSGYQLTQALIAFGRGEWFGVGLGGSVQKLFYLPEAHTDFVFAVLSEELGLLGAFSLIVLFAIFIVQGFRIGLRAEKIDDKFSAYLSYGITLWIGLQALINMGVNTGILPTKGLTLPFLSYGGSSMIMMCIAVGFLFKIDYTTRRKFRKYNL